MKTDAATRPTADKKLRIEISRGNYARLSAYLDSVNDDPARVAPRIGAAHVVNEALVALLGGKEG